jgi:hypothetical protein
MLTLPAVRQFVLQGVSCLKSTQGPHAGKSAEVFFHTKHLTGFENLSGLDMTLPATGGFEIF